MNSMKILQKLFSNTEKIIKNFKVNGQLTMENCIKLILYNEFKCWKPEDLCLLGCPPDRFSKYFEDGDMLYEHVVSKIPGDIVGDAALKEQNPRNATLCAITEVKCLSIDKQTFDEYLGNSTKQTLERVKFFQQRFIEINKKELRNLHCMFDHKTFNRGQTIFIEGDPALNLYIVDAGVVGLFNFNKNNSNSNNKIVNLIERASRDIMREVTTFEHTGIFEFKKNVDNSSNKILNIHKAIPVSEVGAGSFFGEESLLINLKEGPAPRCKFTAIAMYEPTSVYCIKRTELDRACKIMGGFASNQLINSSQVF